MSSRKPNHPPPKVVLNNYSGNQSPSSGILTWIPSSWVPYVQLARLVPPAGLFLIYFPHAFGLLHGAIRLHTPPDQLLFSAITMLGGSFFVSNAIHIWNDLIDAPLDAKVSRTCHRPIPRGAVSPFAALVYTATQTAGALLFLSFIPSPHAWRYVTPAVVAWAYYPWAKRHTYYPQIVLGLCLAWGIVMGELALGVEAFGLPWGWLGIARTWHFDSGIASLVGASVLWTVIYDTVYAHQDLKDDRNAGIKSIAVLYGAEGTKGLLWRLLAVLSVLLSACGYFGSFGPSFYFIGVGGTVVSLAVMISQVQLEKEESCWWWFGNGFWFAGGAIVGGLLAEYIFQVVLV